MQLPFGKKAAGSASAQANQSKSQPRGGAAGKSGAKDSAKAAGSAGGSEQPKGKRSSVSKDKPTEPGGMFGAPAAILGPRLVFILAIVILCTIGLVMIYSSSSIEAYTDSGFGNNPHYFFKQQAKWLVVGIVVCVVAAKIPYRIWNIIGLSTFLWVFTVGMLIAVIAGLGVDLYGATRSLHWGPISIQPAEFAKITVVLLIANILERWNSGQLTVPLAAGEFAIVACLTVVLIVKQPDLGTTIILMVGIMVALILAGVKARYLLTLVAVAVVVIIGVCVAQPYHLDRIWTMVNPWGDAQGDGYQSVQGFLAFGSGGIFGTGLGLSRQKYSYIPFAYNDFIYAVIGEELGLVGALAVLALFVIFIVSGLLISRKARDNHGAVLAGAFTSMVGFQAMVNMACVVGMAPVTGKALPFISYGGSSLVATMIMCGVVLSVSLQSRLDNQVEKRRENLLVVQGGRQQASGTQGRDADYDDYGDYAEHGSYGNRNGRGVRNARGGSGSGYRGYGSGAYGAGSKAGSANTSSRRGTYKQPTGQTGRSSGGAAYGVYGRNSSASSARNIDSRRNSGSLYGSASGSDRPATSSKRSRSGSTGTRQRDAGSMDARNKVRKGDLDIELVDIAPRSGRPSRNDTSSRRSTGRSNASGNNSRRNGPRR